MHDKNCMRQSWFFDCRHNLSGNIFWSTNGGMSEEKGEGKEEVEEEREVEREGEIETEEEG